MPPAVPRTMREATAALAKWSEFAVGNELGDALRIYLEALGDRPVGIKPGPLIIRGEKLRRLRGEPGGTGSNVPVVGLDDLISAHNLLVGLDPFLASIERASAGPDAPLVVLSLDAIKAVIDSAKAAQLPTPEAAGALSDAAENVPTDAAANDRRLHLANESLKNFIRQAVTLVKQHGWKVATGGWIAAGWMQRHMEWLLAHFQNEPSIVELLHWIERLML